MARRITSKEFDALVQRLERIADGIIKHKGEEGYPDRLDEAQRRVLRNKLEDLRGKYEALLSEADQAYDAYADHFNFCAAESAKDNDMLRGFYGKNSAKLADYGIRPIAKPSGRAKQPAKPKS